MAEDPNTPTRQRAIDPADKEKKRTALLMAARDLFLADPGQLPSVSAIAKRCGFAKGTVYLYFKTKEEIFLMLLCEGHSRLHEQVTQKLAGSSYSQLEFVEKLTKCICDYVEQHPEYLPLFSFSLSVIEQNVSLEEVRDFKLKQIEHLNQFAQQVTNNLPMSFDDAKQIIMQTYALVLGIWQTGTCSSKLAPLLGEDPMFELLTTPFRRQVESAIKQLWLGSIPLRQTA